MSKDKPPGEQIVCIAFLEPVDFLGLMGEKTWRYDKHGAEVGNDRPRSRVSISQGVVTIEPIGERPKGDEGRGSRWRVVRVPVTNVSYWHTSGD